MLNSKNPLEVFQEEERIRKEEEKQKAAKEQMAESFIFSAKLKYRDKLNNIFYELENEIQKDCRLYELEQFKDYVNTSYEIIMSIINEKYSPDILERHRFKNVLGIGVK